MKRICFYIFFIFFFIASHVYASVSVELALDRASAGMSDTVVMKVNVSGAKKTSLPQFLGLDAFDIVIGPTSTKVQIINGKTLLGVNYTFYLSPLKHGDFEIGPASVMIDGKAYYSNKVHLVIEKNSKKRFGKQKDALFIEASVSKESLFVNQQALYLVKFFRSSQVSDLSLDMPDVQGITFESLGEPKEYSSVIESRNYEVVELRYAINAKKAGRYRILPLKIRMTVYEKNRRNGFFQDPFFSMRAGRPVYLASNEIMIEVKNLPVKNRPSDFTGLVGKFTMDSSTEPEIIKANDSLTLTIQVSGSGNIRQIPDLTIKDIDDVKIYQDKPVLNIKKSAIGIAGTKAMKWAIVPEKKGVFIIPEFFLSYFDPVKESYIKLTTGPIKIKVLADPKSKMDYLRAIPVEDSESLDFDKKNMKKSVVRIGKDIFPVHTSKDPLKLVRDHNYMKWLFIFLILSPPAIFLAVFAVMTLKKRKAMHSDALKSKNSGRICINRLGREHLTPQNIYDVVVEYLNDRFLLNRGVVTPDEAAEILLERGSSDDISGHLHKNMKQLEAAIFAGKGQENFDYNIQGKLLDLVKSIEKEIR